MSTHRPNFVPIGGILLTALHLTAQSADTAGWLRAIEATDRSVLAASAVPPPGLAAALKPRIPAMNDRARVVAAQVLEKIGTAEAAVILLPLVKDPSFSVVSAAARALRETKNPPPAEDILRLLPTVEAPAIRAQLFLSAGNAAAPLPALRRALTAEPDPRTKQFALAAAIRCGGDIERSVFATEVSNAMPNEVPGLMDLLVYTRDKRMAAALLPLFDGKEPVMRISPDPKSQMARRSDLAVWTAHRLGLIPELRLTAIRNFDAATTAAAKSACARNK